MKLTFEEASKAQHGGTMLGLVRSGQTDRVNFLDEDRPYLKTETTKNAKAIEDCENNCFQTNNQRVDVCFGR